MQGARIKIYIKGRRRPLATINVQDYRVGKELFDSISEQFKTKSVISIGDQMIIKASEFRYATIIYINNK